MSKRLISYLLCFALLMCVGVQPTFAVANQNSASPYEKVLNKVFNDVYLVGGEVKIPAYSKIKLSQNELSLLPTVEKDLNTLFGTGNLYFDKDDRAKFRTVEQMKEFKSVELESIKSLNDKVAKSTGIVLRSLPDEPEYFSLQRKANANVQYLEEYYDELMDLFIKYPQSYIMPQLQTQIEFASKVAEGEPWDYKREIGWNQYRTVRIDGVKYYLTGEDIGNIHYAYVGRSIGFSKSTLCLAGGVVQILTTKGGSLFQYSLDSYYDDPTDQAAIKRGADWYNSGRFN